MSQQTLTARNKYESLFPALQRFHMLAYVGLKMHYNICYNTQSAEENNADNRWQAYHLCYADGRLVVREEI